MTARSFSIVAAFCAALMACALPDIARAQAQANDKGKGYVVTYLEAAPAARARIRAMLRAYRDASVKEGAESVVVLQRIDRPQQFALLETWKDAKAQADHAAAAQTKEFRGRIKPFLVAPYDERPLFQYALGPSGNAGSGAIYAVTHVDFVGSKKDDGLAALKQLSGESVKDAGVVRYDVMQQASRVNHITLIEVWRSRRALEAHERSAHMIKFRETLLPIGGALYDQRLYRRVG